MLGSLLAVAAGGLAVFAFEPFAMPVVAFASLAALFALWDGAATPRRAALQGFAYGLGLFGFGVSWVYIALETFGGMPLPIAVIATGGFVAYLALWTALAGWLAARLTRPRTLARGLAAAGAFVLCEWLRGYVFTGFPWLAMGYSQVVASGAHPLAGFAPVGGVFLVSLAVALVAAALLAVVRAVEDGRWREAIAMSLVAAALGVAGAALRSVEWTQPAGDPVAVSLLQGNVSQEQKFDPRFRPHNVELYDRLVQASKGRIVVLPESAYPQFIDTIEPAVFAGHAKTAEARDGAVLVGLFVALKAAGAAEEDIHNSVVSIDGKGDLGLYRKHHLVPFGESIPLKPLAGWFINRVLDIPLADQAAGPPGQRPFAVAGQRLAVNICYEDVFGAELIPAARDATLLVNVTNDAWYGRSIAARQHNQIAAMRALETGRPMLRATNTGITSAIAHDGRVIAELPWFTQGVLEVTIAGRTGETPFLRFGDWTAIVASALLLAACALFAARGARRPGEKR